MGRTMTKWISMKKVMKDFVRELKLTADFQATNREALRKIVKKADKRLGGVAQQDARVAAWDGDAIIVGVTAAVKDMVEQSERLLEELDTLRPASIGDGWASRKVYTIGCFDLFHRGHENLLRTLREFGNFLVVGVHDDQSYYKLKNKYPIDNLETRLKNIRPFVDIAFVIPHTDPTAYIHAAISDADVAAGCLCYVRGDDMPRFPARELVESLMPVYLLPRSEGVSSTLVRAIYYTDDSTADAAASATVDHLGRPIIVKGDDDGAEAGDSE
eukprot:PLAT5238.2.p1 GENE.PLAT5238.2~~PLAT5238.2.p1  ORF type:complete len:272 (-),score=122.39 PLAT5238.2:77-892(-)